MKKFPVFRGASGLNTRIDPVRLSNQGEVAELAEAINVDISPSYRINRRRGYVKKISMPVHSLYSQGKIALFVSDKVLYLLESDYTYRSLATLISNEKMAYCDANDKIYYTNNSDLGFIEEGIRFPWEKTNKYIGPITARVMSGPFPGNHLEFHVGRIYIVKDTTLWYSEYGALNWYDMARNYIPFSSKIRMVRSIQSGLFVSTEKHVYFLQGLVPKEFIITKVLDFPAFEWSDSIDKLNGSIFWGSKNGLIRGNPDGSVKELNRDKIIYPDGLSGATLIKGYNIVHTIM